MGKVCVSANGCWTCYYLFYWEKVLRSVCRKKQCFSVTLAVGSSNECTVISKEIVSTSMFACIHHSRLENNTEFGLVNKTLYVLIWCTTTIVQCTRVIAVIIQLCYDCIIYACFDDPHLQAICTHLAEHHKAFMNLWQWTLNTIWLHDIICKSKYSWYPSCGPNGSKHHFYCYLCWHTTTLTVNPALLRVIKF